MRVESTLHCRASCSVATCHECTAAAAVPSLPSDARRPTHAHTRWVAHTTLPNGVLHLVRQRMRLAEHPLASLDAVWHRSWPLGPLRLIPCLFAHPATHPGRTGWRPLLGWSALAWHPTTRTQRWGGGCRRYYCTALLWASHVSAMQMDPPGHTGGRAADMTAGRGLRCNTRGVQRAAALGGGATPKPCVVICTSKPHSTGWHVGSGWRPRRPGRICNKPHIALLSSRQERCGLRKAESA